MKYEYAAFEKYNKTFRNENAMSGVVVSIDRHLQTTKKLGSCIFYLYDTIVRRRTSWDSHCKI